MKRSSSSQPCSSSPSRASRMASSPKSRARSLSVSSRRECSRRASRPRATSLMSRLGLSLGLHLLRRPWFGGGGQQDGPQLGLDVLRHLRVVLEVLAGVVLALADALTAVAVPGPGLVHDAFLDAEVDEFAFAGDPLAIVDIELGGAERRRHLVLDHLDPRLTAHHLVALLDGADAAD